MSDEVQVKGEQGEQVEPTRDEQIIKAKELYSQGSRNYLVGCFSEAADDLSQVCALYEELHGELSDELGIPYLLYAKSLIALALDENKVIDVPDEEEDDDDEEDGDDNNVEVVAENKNQTPAASTLETIKDEEETESSEANEKKEQSSKEADSTDDNKAEGNTADSTVDELEVNKDTNLKTAEEAVVTSTEDVKQNGNSTKVTTTDGEKPSTSNGIAETEEEEEENEAASSLQLAWEILELAAKIFTRQGISGLSNLAEVQTELANIEFENNILDSAREDYEKAINIFKQLPDKYRRAMAEIHYKVGLTYLMQQMNKEGAESLKEACSLIEDEIAEIRANENLTDKDKEIIKDLEETNQEILAKIAEIEETRQQNIAEVRAALDSFIAPAKEKTDDGAGPSSSAASSSAITSSSKPTDISHLIKRKKPDTQPSSEAEAAESPAKRPAV